MKNKNICVIGVGYWGINHVNTLLELNSLAAIVESNKKTLSILQRKYKNINFYNSLNEAIKSRYDGYIIATPAETHYDIGKKLLEKKLNVLIEKPITLKSIEAKKLNELSKKNNVILMVGHILLFHPAFNKIKEIIDSGLIGKIQYMYSNRLNLGKVRTHENVFWSLAPHDIALFQYFNPIFPTKVTSRGIDIFSNNIQDTTITTLEYSNKIMGHIFVSWLHPFKEHRFVVIGSRGMLCYENNSKSIQFYDKKIVWKDGVPKSFDGNISHIYYDTSTPLSIELKYFIDCLESKRISIADGQSAYEVIKLLEIATKDLNKYVK